MADGRLVFDTKIDSSGFKSGISSLGKVGAAGLKTVNAAMAVTAAAVTGIGVASIKVGMDFEKGMSQVKAISGATDKEMESLTKTAKQLGATTQFSASEAAAGMEFLAMAGYKTNEITESMPGLLDLAAAGQLELADAADITTNIMSGFGLEAKETGKVADILAKAAATANTDVGQLGEAMKYVAPVANSLGISIEETSAAVGVLSNAGIQGGQAGTVLRAGLLRLAKPTGQAADLIDELGISVFDSNGEMKDMPGIVSELEKGLAGMTDEQKTATMATIFGTEAVSGWTAILGEGSEGLAEYTKDLENADGAAEEMAKTMNDNLKGDITLVKSALEGIGIEIYESIVNPLRESVQWFGEWASSMNQMLVGAEGWREKLIEMTGATGDFKKEIENMPEGAEGAAVMFGMFITDMVDKVSEKLPEIVDKGIELVQSFADGIINNSEAIGGSLGQIVSSILTFITSMYPMFIEMGAGLIVNMLEGIVDNASQLVDAIVNAVTSIVGTLGGMLPKLLSSGKKIIESLLKGISDLAPDLVELIVDLLSSVVQTIADIAPTLLEVAGELIMTLLGGVMELLPVIIETIVELIGHIVEFISNNLSDVVEAVVEIVVLIVDKLIESLPMLIEFALELLMAIVEAIVDNLPVLIDALPIIMETIVKALIDSVDKILKIGPEILTTLVHGLLGALPNLAQAYLGIMNALVDGIVNMLPKLIPVAIDAVMTLVEGIYDSLPLVITAAVELISALLEHLLVNVPMMLVAAIEIVIALIGGIIGAIPMLVMQIPKLIVAIVQAILGALGLIIQAAIQIIMAIIQGIFVGFPKLVKATLDIMRNIADAFKNFSWIDLGKDIIKGIASGIMNMGGWLKDKAMGTVSKVTDGIKGVFKINSPSKLMEDEVGENIMLGISVGMGDGMPGVLRGIKRDMPNIAKTIDGVISENQFSIGGPKSNPVSTERSVVGSNEEFELAGNVNTVIEIDGREVARSTTPYVSEELELKSKRRR